MVGKERQGLAGGDLSTWRRLWILTGKSETINHPGPSRNLARVFKTQRPRIQCAIQIRMVAGFAEIVEERRFLVAGVRFELTTFGL